MQNNKIYSPLSEQTAKCRAKYSTPTFVVCEFQARDIITISGNDNFYEDNWDTISLYDWE